MSLKQTVAILISVLFLCASNTSLAQTTTSSVGKFTFLNKGDRAPFTGTLFSVEATAKLLAEKEKAQKECELNIKYEREKLNAKCERDSKLLATELAIEKKKYKLIVAAQDEEIERLQKLAQNSNDYDLLWFTGGTILGVITSVAIFFAASEIVKR